MRNTIIKEMPDRKKQPAIECIDKINIQQPEIYPLDNGIPLYVLNDTSLGVVKLEIVFDAGNWYQKRPVLAKACNSLLQEGTQKRDSSQIAQYLDHYGAYSGFFIDKDVASVMTLCVSRYFSQVVPIIEEIIKFPTFPKREVETYLEIKKQRFLVNQKKVRFLASQHFSEAVFGSEHPYGRPANVADYETLTRKELVGFHAQHYGTGSCFIILSGKITPKIIDTVTRSFSDTWGKTTKQKLKNSPGKSMAAGRINVKVDDAIQCAIRIGRPLFSRAHDDFMDFQVLNTILGGYFGSRLMSNIREDKGYTYGIGSIVSTHRHGGSFSIASEVGANVCEDAIKEVYKEIDILQNKLVPKQELETVRNYLVGAILRNLDGAIAVSERLKSVLESGTDLDYYKRLIASVNAIKPARIRDLANMYLKKEDLIEVVAGPPSS